MPKIYTLVHKIFLILFTITTSSFARTSVADSCHFQYWEPISNKVNCKTYYLPDFEFRVVSNGKTSHNLIRPFCTQYEIRSKFGKQTTAYCYTGDGDRSGPSFRLGDEKADPDTLLNEDRVFMADLSFKGCVKGIKEEGIMFIAGHWKDAPKGVKRFWSLEKPNDTECVN